MLDGRYGAPQHSQPPVPPHYYRYHTPHPQPPYQQQQHQQQQNQQQLAQLPPHLQGQQYNCDYHYGNIQHSQAPTRHYQPVHYQQQQHPQQQQSYTPRFYRAPSEEPVNSVPPLDPRVKPGDKSQPLRHDLPKVPTAGTGVSVPPVPPLPQRSSARPNSHARNTSWTAAPPPAPQHQGMYLHGNYTVGNVPSTRHQHYNFAPAVAAAAASASFSTSSSTAAPTAASRTSSNHSRGGSGSGSGTTAHNQFIPHSSSNQSIHSMGSRTSSRSSVVSVDRKTRMDRVYYGGSRSQQQQQQQPSGKRNGPPPLHTNLYSCSEEFLQNLDAPPVPYYANSEPVSPLESSNSNINGSSSSGSSTNTNANRLWRSETGSTAPSTAASSLSGGSSVHSSPHVSPQKPARRQGTGGGRTISRSSSPSLMSRIGTRISSGFSSGFTSRLSSRISSRLSSRGGGAGSSLSMGGASTPFGGSGSGSMMDPTPAIMDLVLEDDDWPEYQPRREPASSVVDELSALAPQQIVDIDETARTVPLASSEALGVTSAEDAAEALGFAPRGLFVYTEHCGSTDDEGAYHYIAGEQIGFRYSVVGALGKGSFGTVLRCRDHKSGRMVAVKVTARKPELQSQVKIEASLLRSLLVDHQGSPEANHFVRYIEHFRFRGHMCIATEMLGPNLYELVKRGGCHGLGEGTVRYITRQLCEGLEFLASKKIIHCDIKPENILLSDVAKCQVKIIDFGSGCYEGKRLYTYIQSRFYRAPEILLGMPYGPPIDMWSLGAIVPELLLGRPLFPSVDEPDQVALMVQVIGRPGSDVMWKSSRPGMFLDPNGVPHRPMNSKGEMRGPPGSTPLRQLLSRFSEDAIDFCESALRWAPDARIRADKAVYHPFVISQ